MFWWSAKRPSGLLTDVLLWCILHNIPGKPEVDQEVVVADFETEVMEAFRRAVAAEAKRANGDSNVPVDSPYSASVDLADQRSGGRP